MDWDDRRYSHRTRRRAGRRTGSPGRATTSSGRICARDLLPHAQAGEATVEFDSANGDLVVDYRLGRDVEEPATIPEIFVFGPDGFQKPIAVKKIAAGMFRGRLQIGAREGLFRVRPLVESRAFPEAGLYRPEAELADYGSNEALLKQVAEFTGGRFQPDPKDVFEPGSRTYCVDHATVAGIIWRSRSC